MFHLLHNVCLVLAVGVLCPRLGEAVPISRLNRPCGATKGKVTVMPKNNLRGGRELPHDMMREVPPLVTVAQFCQMTGMHPVSVRRALSSGRIPGDKVNGHWLIPGAYVIKNSVDYMRARERADAEYDNVMEELAARADRDAEKAERDFELAQANMRMTRKRARELRRRAGARGDAGLRCDDVDVEGDDGGCAGALCLA